MAITKPERISGGLITKQRSEEQKARTKCQIEMR